MRRHGHLQYLTLPLLISALSIPGGAQEADNSFEDFAELEEIVILGSHLKSSNFTSPSPMDSIGRQEIARQGVPTLTDIMKTMTINSGSEFNVDPGTQNISTGTSQFNLRNLGLGSTLVLVNGRRHATHPAAADDGATFVDINSFPLAMIGRIDILKDGASALYGSDAVAGVVNLVTRTDLNGIEIDAQRQQTTRSDKQADTTLNIAAGLSNDTTSAQVFFTYFDRSSLTGLQRDFFVDNLGPAALTPASNPASFFLAAPVTNFNGTGAALPPFTPVVDPNCAAAGGTPTGPLAGFCLVNEELETDANTLIPTEERIQGYATIKHDVSDSVELFGEFGFTRNRATRAGARTFQDLALTTLVPGDHPNNPFFDAATGLGVPVLFFGRATNERVDTSTDTDSLRGVFGLAADLNDIWSLDAAYHYSEVQSRVKAGDGLRDQLQATIMDHSFNPFASAVVDPAQANSEETLNRIYSFAEAFHTSKLQTVDVTLSGSMFELPGGPVGIAIGGQYRHEHLHLDWGDEYNDRRFIFLLGGDDSKDSRGIYAGFLEVALPVMEDLEVQLALRHESYGGEAGSTTDPKIAVNWQPMDSLSFRSSFSTAFKAPSLFQTSASQTILRRTINPASGQGQLTAFIAANNPDLKPEKSQNFNIGTSFEPTDGLTLTADYWRFKFEDVIIKDDVQSLLNEDFADDGAFNNSPFGGETPLVTNGAGIVSLANITYKNAASINTSGLDVSANYETSLNDYGDISVSAQVSYVFNYELQTTPTGDIIDGVGFRNASNPLGRSQPDWRGNFAVNWSKNGHSATVLLRHVAGYTDDGDPENLADIKSSNTVDLQYSYAFGDKLPFLEGTSITVGAINIFDQDPPLVLTTDRFFDPKVGDPRGRMLYMKLGTKF